MNTAKSKDNPRGQRQRGRNNDTTASPEDPREQFMANLRQALEHIGDTDWLKTHAPLESPILARPSHSGAAARPPSTGVQRIDARLQLIYQDWAARPKTGLQQLLWSVVQQLPPEKDLNIAALLLLTYFEDPRRRQSEIIKDLAVGQSTYYRQLNTAMEALEQALLTHLQPSLRLELPTAPSTLIGRERELATGISAIRDGRVVNLIGPSGLGKTSLGATLAQQWIQQKRPAHQPHWAVFWYTIRPTLTDNVQQVIYALAFFLHQQGQSDLWLHLSAYAQGIGPVKAMAMIRKALEAMQAAPPLLCFDEVDLLLPSELDDHETHAQLRALLEDLIESPRSGAPVLLIGQRLLMDSPHSQTIALKHFGHEETSALLQHAGLLHETAATTPANDPDSAINNVQRYTHGNPLLLQLLITLQQLGEPVLTNPARLTQTASLDWYIARLRRHLSAREQDLLDGLSVYDAPAPADIWRKQLKTIERLIALNLIERDAQQHLSLTQAVRDALRRQLPDDIRASLHLAAAQTYASRGAYTLAAHHYVQGHAPEMAIWLWHDHQDGELKQGQTQTAWQIFQSIRYAPLTDERDRKALALVLAQLAYVLGHTEDGGNALDRVDWPPARPAHSTSRARELRAKLLAMRGDIDNALIEYRASLDAITPHGPTLIQSLTRPITVRTEMAQQARVRARDLALAQREATLAKADVELLLGTLARETAYANDARDEGDGEALVQQTFRHFQLALEAAQASDDPVRLAQINEQMGLMHARLLNVDAAQAHLEEAGRQYQRFGNVICAIGTTRTNMAYAYLNAHRYVEAIAPAQEAIDFFTGMRQPYWLSLNEANLAEACAWLGQLERAESMAWRALAHEEAAVRPYCLYVLAEVRRRQQRLDEAQQLCEEAIAAAQANSDALAAGPAWRVLAQVYRDGGQRDAAKAALTNAIAVYAQAGVSQEVAQLVALAAASGG